MYNFPHQFSDLAKLQRTLAVFSRLKSEERDLDDDTVVGGGLARDGVYQFRDKRASLAENLRRERAKPRGNRGTEAAARDLRRFFELTGLMERDAGEVLQITPLGERLLAATPNSPEANAIWRTAMENIALVTANGAAHPYLILLRLVREIPGIDTPKLALCLEARDDSDEEFETMRGLAARNWNDVLRERRIPEPLARDAIKILPSIARQLGDLVTRRNQNYLPERAPARRVRRVPTAPVPRAGAPAVVPPRQNRRVAPEAIARAPQFDTRPPDEADYQNLEATVEARRARLERHEEIVRRLAGILSARGYTLYVDPYDTLGKQDNVPSVLVEVKTLSGGDADEVSQVRAALAQLLYYENLEVPPELRPHGLVRIAVFESEIAERHATFLHSMGLLVAWFDAQGNLVGSVLAAPRLQELGLVA